LGNQRLWPKRQEKRRKQRGADHATRNKLAKGKLGGLKIKWEEMKPVLENVAQSVRDRKQNSESTPVKKYLRGV